LNNQLQEKESSGRSVAITVLAGLKTYLTDWRNLLGHALLGVVFVVVAVWAPIRLWVKLLIIACLICANLLRMRAKHIKTDKESVTE